MSASVLVTIAPHEKNMHKRLSMVAHGGMDKKSGRQFFVTIAHFQNLEMHTVKGIKVDVAGAEPSTFIDPKAYYRTSTYRRQGEQYEGSVIGADLTPSTKRARQEFKDALLRSAMEK